MIIVVDSLCICVMKSQCFVVFSGNTVPEWGRCFPAIFIPVKL